MAMVLLGTPVTTFAEEVVGEVTLSADGKTVTGVTAPEGKEQKDITKVEIPASVTAIGAFAFYGCASLTSFDRPASVTTIGSSAFYACTSLASVSIPALVTTIGSNAFYDCSSLTSIDIPESVTTIGSRAFTGCSSLTSLTVDPANTKYKSENNLLLSKDGKKLIYCPGGLDAVTIPATVATIESSAFFASRSLTSVDILGQRYLKITLRYGCFFFCEVKSMFICHRN